MLVSTVTTAGEPADFSRACEASARPTRCAVCAGKRSPEEPSVKPCLSKAIAPQTPGFDMPACSTSATEPRP
eukprot:CAMPEP_0115720916 /NCGR_PEP_ID=MMETSP0272-20121206/78802_1 /TAXON_ID=71861 /ORGANISM="Scrippsiella trochoidea, Strain CCMP3099" /LENGTH=71 /DNA_ID=CAMNT_0003163709 /DNA_START=61 /DNA_END=273 /DNA_ORIENTATION=+